MLAKKFRLPIGEFLPRKPKTIKTPNFSLKYLPNQLLFNRVSVVISKKTEKSSARRNRVKRIILDFFRQKKNIPKKGTDILISPTKKILELKSGEIKKIISEEIILIDNF